MTPNTPEQQHGQLSFFVPEKQTENIQPDSHLDGYANEEHYDNESDDQSADIVARKDTPITSQSSYDDEPEPQPDAEIAPEHNVRPQKVHTTSTEIPFPELGEKKHSRFFNLDYRESIILSFLLFIGSGIAKVFRNSLTAAIFTAFQRTCAIFKDSYLYSLVTGQRSKNINTSLKKTVRRSATEAVIPASISSLSSSLMKIKSRTYGISILTFGSVTLIIHFLLSRNFDFFNSDVYAPITGAMLILIGVLMLFYNGTLSKGIKESALLSTLIFGFLGIKRPSFSDNDEIDFPISGAFAIGALLGCLTTFYPAHIILAVIMTALYTFIVVKYPETGLVSLILIIPFVYNTALVYIVCVITVSYIFKLLSGKRTSDFEFPDIFAAFFLLLTFFSSFFTFGKATDTLTSAAFILVYFLCICTLRDKIWFERAINSVILGSCVFAAYSIIVTFVGNNLHLGYIEYYSNTDYGNPEASAISSTAILGFLLLAFIPFMFATFFTAKSKSNKLGFVLLIAASLIYLYRETSISMQLALIISLILFFILKTNKTFIFLILGAAILPLLPLFYNGIYSGVEQLTAEEHYRLDIWNAVINMLGKYGVTGIGNSREAFETLYASYYVGNTVTVPHAHSMLLQIFINLGFLGLLLFMIVVFFIMQGSFSYGRNCADKSSKNRLVCYAGMCSVIAMVICGIFENISFNPRAMLIFWLVCGLTVCARRSAKDLPASAEFLVELDENYNG